MEWEYFNKFRSVNDKYLPDSGEGDTMATQIVTAVNKLVYKWYNDGDVYDNTFYMDGWCNDLSSYANWLYKNVPQTQDILDRIEDCISQEDYEDILVDLAEMCLDMACLDERWSGMEKTGSIYKCRGKYQFNEPQDEEEDEWW